MKKTFYTKLFTLIFGLSIIVPSVLSAAPTNITGATINGGSSATVVSGTNVDIAVTTNVTGNWKTTQYAFATSTPAIMACVDTADSSGNGPFTPPSFSASTPALAGTYNLYVSVHASTDCTGDGDSDVFSNVLTIYELTAQTIDFSVAPLTKTYGDAPVALSATSTSGLGVTFSTASASTTCTVAGNTVTFTGTGSCIVDANQAGNMMYSAAPTVSQTFTIAPALLTVDVSGITATKVYDGNTTATLSGSPIVTGVIAPDNIGTAVASYDNKNVDTGKTVTFSFNGVDAYKYTLSASTTTGDITIRTLDVSASGTSKVYDGTTDASTAVVYGDNKVSGDDIMVSGSAIFDTKHVGTGKDISITGIALTGDDATNYTYNATTSTTGDITALAITITAQADTKEYDGTTSSVVLPMIAPALASGDSATTSQTFASSSVGTGITLTPTIVIADDNGGNNYAVTLVTQDVGTITTRSVTLSGISIDSKVYDKTTDATISTSTTPTVVGVIAGDESNVGADLSVATAAYDDANVGTAKNVTVTGATLTGTAAGNYTLTLPATTTGNITARALTITAATSTKVYDGTTNSSDTPNITSGALAGSDVASTTQSFDTKHVGTEKTLTPSGFILDDNGGNNYALTFVNSTNGTITPALLTVSATGNDKVYDGTTDATVTFSDDRITGDILTVTGTSTFANKNVNTNITVSIEGITLSGTDAANYTNNPTTSTTADITALEVTAVVSAPNKVYDTITSVASSTCSVSVLGSDDVTCSITGVTTFDTATVGTGKTITASEVSLGGDDASNYALTSTVATGTADIIKAPVTVTFTTENKVYDANTSATTTSSSLTGVLSEDDVSVTGGTATFDTKHVGTGKTVSATGFTLIGDDADNYDIDTVATTTADITEKWVSIAFTAANKMFDNTTAATILGRSVLGAIEDDSVVAIGGTATFADAAIGNDKLVTASMSGFTLDGSDADNYSIMSESDATTTANITATPPVEQPSVPVTGPVGPQFGSESGRGGGSSNGGGISSGTPISGSATSTLSCAPTFTMYMKLGKVNNKNEVTKLQKFLNKHLGLKIPVTGFFGPQTFAAVKVFQAKYPVEVLAPWKYSKPTGYVYITTLSQLNALVCAEQGNQ
jgi:hypothetical protein